MLKTAKLVALRTAKRVGAYEALRESRWRRERLLILCYHGVSLQDEHRWNPQLYLSPELFEQRLMLIREGGYTVLPLDVALSRLYSDDLPAKSICLTFDDGFHDFSAVAYPLLQKYEVPATVYLTSFYSENQLPVFDVMCSYILWKARDRTLDTTEIYEEPSPLPLGKRGTRQKLAGDIRRAAAGRNYSAGEKNEFLRKLASQLRVDYEACIEARLLQLMSADEVGMLDPQLIQVEMHTHRHRVPPDEQLFRREIIENRDYIHDVTKGRMNPTHFCYPSGTTSPTFLPWLQELGIASATTCRPGLACRSDNPLMLPRFLDASSVSSIEFDGWLTGLASELPRRPVTQS